MSDSASVPFAANLAVLLLRARFNIPDLGPREYHWPVETSCLPPALICNLLIIVLVGTSLTRREVSVGNGFFHGGFVGGSVRVTF